MDYMVELTQRVPGGSFSLIYPTNSNTYWVKQAGGMSVTQVTLEGIYVPLGELKYNFGWPDWVPNGPNFTEKLCAMDLREAMPDEEFETLPAYIQEDNSFHHKEEYFNWIDNSENHGWFTLWGDLRRFTYGIFENLDSDPRERWEDVDNLWEEIDDRLPFEYEEVPYNEYMESELSKGYPQPQNAVRPIEITNITSSSNYSDLDDLVGETVFLLCPNAD